MTISVLHLSLLAVLAAAMLSSGIIWAIRPWLLRHALAKPNARSSHRIPTPQGAGIAVIGATLVVVGAITAMPAPCGVGMKILVSAALLYFALRKANFSYLASRIDVASLGWIGLAIAVTFLQIFVGVLRWREVGAECGAPLAITQAMRFNLIGAFFNQTLPSSIGGDAVRLWLVARAGAGWRV